MKRKTKLIFAVGTVITVLMAFCLTVSAYDYIDSERLKNADIVYCAFSTGTLVSSYDMTLRDDEGTFEVYFLYPTYDVLNVRFGSEEFLSSSQSGYAYVNYQTSGYLDYIQFSTTIYSNLDTFRGYLNGLGDKYRSDYNTITGLENNISSLNSQIDSLNYQIDVLQNDYNNLMFDFDSLSLENTTLKQDIAVLQSNIDVLSSQLEKAISDNELAYNTGLNDGLETGDAFQRGFNEFFNAPFYVLKEMFNFEIFGINFYNILKYLLTMAVTAFVVKTFV